MSSADRVFHTPDEVRVVTNQVLSDPAYEQGARQAVVPEGLGEFIHRVLDTISDWFESITQGLRDLSLEQPVLFWCIMAVLVLVLGLLLWHIVYALSVLFRVGDGTSTADENVRQRVLRFDRLWEEAHRLSKDGDHAEGIRHLLLALLARADDQRLALAPGWTNGEVVRHLTRYDVGALDDVVSTFNRVWYGRQRAAPEDFQRCRDLVSASVERLHQRRDHAGRSAEAP